MAQLATQRDGCRYDGVPEVATRGRRLRMAYAAMFSAFVVVCVCEQTTVGVVRGRRRLRLTGNDNVALMLEQANAVQQRAAAEVEHIDSARVDAAVRVAVPRGLDWQHEMLVFLHVPKAGGSVVKRVLQRWGEHNGKLVGSHEFSFLTSTKAIQSSHIGVWGHRGYGIHRQQGWKTSKRAKYFTFLRNPMDRLISQCVGGTVARRQGLGRR